MAPRLCSTLLDCVSTAISRRSTRGAVASRANAAASTSTSTFGAASTPAACIANSAISAGAAACTLSEPSRRIAARSSSSRSARTDAVAASVDAGVTSLTRTVARPCSLGLGADGSSSNRALRSRPGSPLQAKNLASRFTVATGTSTRTPHVSAACSRPICRGGSGRCCACACAASGGAAGVVAAASTGSLRLRRSGHSVASAVSPGAHSSRAPRSTRAPPSRRSRSSGPAYGCQTESAVCADR